MVKTAPRFRFPGVFFILPILLFLLGNALPAAGKTYRMKIQSTYPHGDLSMDQLKTFAREAEVLSDGRLQIRVFADPELVPGDQLLGATRQGVVTMLHGMGGMWSGVIPVGNVEFNLPLAFRIEGEMDFEEKAKAVREFFFEGKFIELLREEYAKHGLYYLDIHTYGPCPFVLSTRPARSCDDLAGMKIRSEGVNLAYHGGVGMQGTALSGLETYMALKLGTVDAAEWDVSAVTGLKWHEVAPYWVSGMEADISIGHILVNKKRWDALPESMKAVLRKAAEQYWHATVNAYKRELAAVETLIGSGELQRSPLDRQCRERYAEAARAIWETMAAEDPASARAIALIRRWKER